MSFLAKPLEVKLKEQTRQEGDCLIWTGTVSQNGGYARVGGIMLHGKLYERVSRIILVKRLGRGLSSDEFAMHKCDNPRCVKDDHIVLGNALLNNRDTVNKGRRVNGFGKVNDQVRKEIKYLRENTKLTQTEISKLFNISQVRVSQVLKHEST